MWSSIDLEKILPRLHTLPAEGEVIRTPDGHKIMVSRARMIEPGRYVITGTKLEARTHGRGGYVDQACFMCVCG